MHRVTCRGPFDLGLSWRVYCRGGSQCDPSGRFAAWLEEVPTVVSLRQTGDSVQLEMEPAPERTRSLLFSIRSMLNADLDLSGFYERAERDPAIGMVVAGLRGLKPLRPPDLFQMMVTAITEQQISMAAAFSIRERLLEEFGTPTGDLIAFPRPRDIAGRGVSELKAAGLSGRKASYILELSRRIEDRCLVPESWPRLQEAKLRDLLLELPGVGEWTVSYLLVRGLGHMDVVPSTDLGVRRAVGRHLGAGSPVSAEEVEELLRSWSPWRGLAVFYLLAHEWRSGA